MKSFEVQTRHDEIYSAIDAELETVFTKLGEQNHPLTAPGFGVDAAAIYGRMADDAKAVNDARASDGTLAWDYILREEVYEALAETDPAKQREELIQAAAMCIATIESIDRGTPK